MPKRKHPIQPVVMTDTGTIRFTENKIVSFLLEQYKPGLNDLVVRFHDNREDYEQLMMLIGYSVSGFGDLDIDRCTIAIADRQAAKLYAEHNAKS